MNNLSVLIKPSSNICNLNCKYCFYNDVSNKRQRSKGTMMTLDTLESIVVRAFEFADIQVTFVFQGGEPTLMGLDFYQTFIEYVAKYNKKNCKVEYTIQTNGICVDKEWLQFFKKNKFLVGLSFDGLPKIQDDFRINHSGKGSFHIVDSVIQQMQQQQVDFNILMVVTKPLAEKVKEAYQYLKQRGIRFFQIIPVLDPLFEGHNNYEYSLSKEDLGNFLIELFNLWYADFMLQQEVRITYFENIIYKMLGNSHVSCAMNGRCSIQMVIESDGSVYPCDFYVLDHWELGNVKNDSFIEIIGKSRANEFVSESDEINSKCHTCQWFGLCLGSCKRYQMGKRGDYTNYYCDSYKAFFEHAHTRMREIARSINKTGSYTYS